jgi:hypothetical protein
MGSNINSSIFMLFFYLRKIKELLEKKLWNWLKYWVINWFKNINIKYVIYMNMRTN